MTARLALAHVFIASVAGADRLPEQMVKKMEQYADAITCKR